LYSEIFQWLPLATIIDSKIFVVHGGISDKTHLKDLALVKRENYVSILKPPFFNDQDSENEEAETSYSDFKLEDLDEWKQVKDKKMVHFIIHDFL
jgi:serine/threonine-protein phosphatase with EF-hand domain